MVWKGVRVSIVKGDLIEEETDVIVNTANGILEFGGGIGKRIVDKGGAIIQEEAR